jgi:hypothetical protein
VDCEPPAFDGLREIEPGGSLVLLHWDPAEDEHGPVTYTVYREEEIPGRELEQVGTTPVLSYPDLTAVPGRLYTYVVRAMDQVGNEDTNLAELTAGSPLGGVTVGEGSEGWDMPFATEWQQMRLQVIYPAEIVGPQRRIHSLALEVAAIPSEELVNWTIRMRHTPLTSYEEPWWETEGWETVYSQGELVSDLGLHTFMLTIPFDYNGTDSLMIDFSFDSPLAGTSGEVLATSGDAPQSLWYSSDGADGPPLDWSGADPAGILEPRFPNIYLGVTELPLFSEDFESGDLTLWSSAS